MPKPNDLSRSRVAWTRTAGYRGDRDEPVELARAGIVPGIERQPAKKLEPDAEALLGLLWRWRDEAVKTGGTVRRLVVAFEAGRDGFWLARWLLARGVEAFIIHSTSVAVSREHRRAKTDRLDTELLKRAFRAGSVASRITAAWSRSRPSGGGCKRPNHERESLVGERTRNVNRMKATQARLGIRASRRGTPAAAALETLRTPEGVGLPPNTLAELRRDMARRASSWARLGRSRQRGWNDSPSSPRNDRTRWSACWRG